MGEGPRKRTLAAGVGGGSMLEAGTVQHGSLTSEKWGARGKERGAQTVSVPADRAGSCPEVPTPSYGGQAKARTTTESLPPLVTSPGLRSGAGRTVTLLGGSANRAPGCRLATRDLLGV